MPSKNCIDEFQKFVLGHRNQLETSGIPQHFWPTLHWKLQESVFDAGETFQIVRVEEGSDEEDASGGEEPMETAEGGGDKEAAEGGSRSSSVKVVVSRESGLCCQDSEHVYLVDHAWTCRPQQARQQLREIPRLLLRMAQLMGLTPPPGYVLGQECPEELVEAVFKRMWLYNQTYSVTGPLATTEDSVPVWYVMDEFGSSVQHDSVAPSVRCVPFYHLAQREAYSVLFPVRDLACGDEVTRDYAEGPPCDPLTRSAQLLPWEPCDLTHVDCNPPEPGADFLRSGRKEESEPDLSVDFPLSSEGRRPLRVYSDYGQVRQCLSHPAFRLVDSEGEADVLWLNYHFKHYRELSQQSPWKRVNQFPFEHVLTVKDLLALVCRRGGQPAMVDGDTLESHPPWLPTTYNLQTELPHFVSYFQRRQRRGLDNVWICKPWNLARSLDTHVTDNLSYILRLPSTGPKVACKYVSEPVLYPREGVGLVKFDFRYVVLLQSVQPLRLYAYRHFWLRFANKPFSLSDFDDYEKHFTVMNYTPSGPQQTTCAEFLERFNQHYSHQPWEKVQAEVFGVLRRVFELACSRPPPEGLAHSPQSRALYAVDLMLEWQRPASASEDNKTGPSEQPPARMQPKLLEVNWAPDCQRACQFYPDFFNDVFAALFLDEADAHPSFVAL